MRAAVVLRLLDRLALASMVAGLLLLLSPWGAWPFRTGFLIVLGATVLHIVTSHLVKPEAP
jgi:hypothetical protein